MENIKNAVNYIIDVWDEVTGKTWRQEPDHVQQKFLEAEKELLNIPRVSISDINKDREDFKKVFKEFKAYRDSLQKYKPLKGQYRYIIENGERLKELELFDYWYKKYYRRMDNV